MENIRKAVCRLRGPLFTVTGVIFKNRFKSHSANFLIFLSMSPQTPLAPFFKRHFKKQSQTQVCHFSGYGGAYEGRRRIWVLIIGSRNCVFEYYFITLTSHDPRGSRSRQVFFGHILNCRNFFVFFDWGSGSPQTPIVSFFKKYFKKHSKPCQIL